MCLAPKHSRNTVTVVSAFTLIFQKMDDDKDSGCEFESNDVSMETAVNDFNEVAVDYCYGKSKTKRNLVRRRTVSDTWFDLGSLWTCRSRHDDREVLSDDEVHCENLVSGETRARIEEYLAPRLEPKKKAISLLDVDESSNAQGDTEMVGNTEAPAEVGHDDTAETVIVEDEPDKNEVEKTKVDYTVDIESHPEYKKVEFYHGSKAARIHVILTQIFGSDDDDE